MYFSAPPTLRRVWFTNAIRMDRTAAIVASPVRVDRLLLSLARGSLGRRQRRCECRDDVLPVETRTVQLLAGFTELAARCFVADQCQTERRQLCRLAGGGQCD